MNFWESRGGEGDIGQKINFSFSGFPMFHRARKGHGVSSYFVSLENYSIPYYSARLSETLILLYTF